MPVITLGPGVLFGLILGLVAAILEFRHNQIGSGLRFYAFFIACIVLAFPGYIVLRASVASIWNISLGALLDAAGAAAMFAGVGFLITSMFGMVYHRLSKGVSR